MATYLFNGVELPALPSWSKTTYPYAYVGYHNGTTPKYIRFAVFKYPLNYYSSKEAAYHSQGSNTSRRWQYQDGAWVSTGQTYTGNKGAIANPKQPFWSNVDVIDQTTGELWIAASEPVPVVEISPRTPQALSMLRGWLTGRRTARMRRPQ